MRPLNIPATNPKNIYSTISVIRKTPYSLGGSRKTFSALSRIKLLSFDKDPAEALDCAGPRKGHMNAFPGVSPRLEDPTTERKVRISMLASEV
jgi:hypothetical protein